MCAVLGDAWVMFLLTIHTSSTGFNVFIFVYVLVRLKKLEYLNVMIKCQVFVSLRDY